MHKELEHIININLKSSYGCIYYPNIHNHKNYEGFKLSILRNFTYFMSDVLTQSISPKNIHIDHQIGTFSKGIKIKTELTKRYKDEYNKPNVDHYSLLHKLLINHAYYKHFADSNLNLLDFNSLMEREILESESKQYYEFIS